MHDAVAPPGISTIASSGWKETTMGKTQTIEDLEKRNAQFRAFMKQVETEADAKEQALHKKIQELVKTHYAGNGWSHARLFGDTRSDYKNYEDWGLDRVVAIIASIGDSLAAKNYPSDKVPESNKASKDAIDTAKDFAGAFMGDYDLIISRVVALLSSVLAQFASKVEASRSAVLRDIPLSGGLHLFFGCDATVYNQQSFLANQYIGSFQVVFEGHVSAQEAQYIAIQEILKTTHIELGYLNTEIIEIRQIQADELKKIRKNNPGNYVSTRATYTAMIDAVKADRANVVAEYDKYKSVTDTIDVLLDKMTLSELADPTNVEEQLSLDELFRDDWEVQLARRYISERLAAQAIYYDLKVMPVDHGNDILKRPCQVQFFYPNGGFSPEFGATLFAWHTETKIRITSVYLNLEDSWTDASGGKLTIDLRDGNVLATQICDFQKLGIEAP
jgi:hypothetical protein